MSLVLAAWIRALEGTRAAAEAGATLPGLLPGLAALHGDRVALSGDGETLSYKGLERRAAAVRQWAAAEGLTAGQTVCLLMHNSPDYVAIWLGLSGAGCVVALLNTNLPGDALLHGISIADASALIAGRSLAPGLEAVAARLPPAVRVWVQAGHGGPWPDFDPQANGAPVTRQPGPADRALLIYTSGTTGLPKAAIISHARIVEWSYWFAGLTGAGPDDRMYDCLPLYHSVGGIVAIGSMLVAGGSVLIRARFSATRFWDDIAANDCTMFQYIGELCRYLLQAPPHPAERAHRVRLACGNGLAADIWEAVQQRFGLPRILEFYAATEGGVSLYNVEGKPGAIGRFPPVLRHRLGIALIRLDPETAQPRRDAAGRCIPCADDEAGEALGRLAHGGRRFDGYTDPVASAAKLLVDVFAEGDAWFRTGDLMRRDAAGFYYFVDRLGDSYRWKGENVSAAEVTAVLRACPGVTDAAVYDVPVPGHDGRAGMAALTVDSSFDWPQLQAGMAARLPLYAQPLFIRLCGSFDFTGTFKLSKSRLMADGFAGTDDPVWVHEPARRRFVPLGAALTEAIMRGTWRP